MSTDQKAACKAFMKQLLDEGIVDASSWPRVQAKWFMEDTQYVCNAFETFNKKL